MLVGDHSAPQRSSSFASSVVLEMFVLQFTPCQGFALCIILGLITQVLGTNKVIGFVHTGQSLLLPRGSEISRRPEQLIYLMRCMST